MFISHTEHEFGASHTFYLSSTTHFVMDPRNVILTFKVWISIFKSNGPISFTFDLTIDIEFLLFNLIDMHLTSRSLISHKIDPIEKAKVFVAILWNHNVVDNFFLCNLSFAQTTLLKREQPVIRKVSIGFRNLVSRNWFLNCINHNLNKSKGTVSFFTFNTFRPHRQRVSCYLSDSGYAK